ncbi:MAG TPA: (d)CMP kinase [bacterium]|nr:(d)CMP kinase [bacterium]
MTKLRIAIDGPAGAGKSSVSKLLAERLNLSYIDTGALYRCVAFEMIMNDIGLDDEPGIRRILADLKITFKMENGRNLVFLGGRDVTAQIRTEQVGMLASTASALPFVREALFAMQRRYAEKGAVVMEGRDIGTVIMPEAQIKIFLTAKPESRADRRMLDIKTAGGQKDYNELLDEIRRRDDQDTQREACPLRPAEDAILLDNSQMDLEQTAAFIVDIAKKKGY